MLLLVDTLPLTPVVFQRAGDSTHGGLSRVQGFEGPTEDALIGTAAGEQ